MGLFGKTRFLDPDVEDWCLGAWDWLMGNLGGMDRLRTTALVTPTREFFPPTAAEGHERALYLLGRVQTLMGMDDWTCQLEPLGQRGAMGTFRLESGKLVISYPVDLIVEPEQLIAALSHELAGGLLASIPPPIPGGPDFRGLATDLTLAFTGFAAMGVGGAYRPKGLRNPFAQSAPTLAEPAWAFALALFAALKGVEIAQGAVPKGAVHTTQQAVGYLKRNPDLLARFRAVDAAPTRTLTNLVKRPIFWR